MKKSSWILLLVPLALIGTGWLAAYIGEPEYAYTPPEHKLDNATAIRAQQFSSLRQYDIWGKTLTVPGGMQPLNARLQPANGAVEVTDDMLKLGRRTLYEETFGNEIFLSDVLGIASGPLKISNIMEAIVRLEGKGTDNLRVELDHDVTVGGRLFHKGEIIDTGLDVAKGAYAPIGMTVKYAEGRAKIGIGCMACHATVNRESGMVVEGAPNTDLNLGLIMALATNSAAYFTHTDVTKLVDYIQDENRSVTNSQGSAEALPDPKLLEDAVDRNLLKWAPGNFDTTVDLVSDITQIPDMFTKGGHPYSWSGFAAVGPFKGLSTFSNNVHAQNTDTLSQMDISDKLWGIDREIYLGTILQNAANPKFRYDPNSGIKPTDFFKLLDPNPDTPGTNEVIKVPNYPKVSAIAPDGLYISSPALRPGNKLMPCLPIRIRSDPRKPLQRTPSV
ncbi:hypothetical protein JCM10914_3897 [Paenibacillus sp. JCM 10914]|nr:hypothetical protein JCM10914_3897 [Paenibacillus sp. JCM 10914]